MLFKLLKIHTIFLIIDLYLVIPVVIAKLLHSYAELWWWSSYILQEPESPWHYVIKVAFSNLSLDASPQISIDYPFVLSSLHFTAARPLSCVISVNLLSFCHLSLVTYHLLFPSIGICPLSLTTSSTFLPYLGIFYLLEGC